MAGSRSADPRPLFVSDLDGTLLRPDGTLGDRTIQTVNGLIAAGGLFTYATGRSYTSASPVTSALNLQVPVITYGGAMIVDPRTGAPRAAITLPEAVVRAVIAATAAPDSVQPIMFATHAGRDRVCWLPERITASVGAFLADRRDDPRLFPLDTWAVLAPGTVFDIAIIGERGPLLALRDRISADLDQCHVVFGEDIYAAGRYWLELTAATGTKATALETIRVELDTTHLVCFGDSENDLPLFAIADVALAVGNAVPDVKQAATAVIGLNSAEGVATWLAANALGAWDRS